ncbi:SDR family NAD(P)-dependent oxidoreductase [Pedococcus bigeumensis]|uniref:SDR family NAD(P)-dependent oxidoreductase n=1 Tax=Pedococcus bigeumensis TaxID=433644 RepID=UPI002FE9FC16
MAHAHRVLLVGGPSEIGLVVVGRLAGADDTVITLAARTSAELRAAEAALCEDGFGTHVLAYEAAWGTAAISMLLAEARRRMGGLDLVVVGVSSPAESSQAPDAGADHPGEPGLQAVLLTNLTGPALVANVAVDVLAAQGHGTVVVALPGASAPGGSPTLGRRVAESGLDELVRGLAVRARHFGVECLVVRPGQAVARASASGNAARLPEGTASPSPAHR